MKLYIHTKIAMRLRLLCLVTIVALGACVYTTGPIFRPVAEQPGSAIVYVYRPGPPKPQAFGERYPRIYVNGEKKFDLKDAGYCVITLPPGQHEIKAVGDFWTNWTTVPVTRTIAVEAGREYYIRVRPTVLRDFETGRASFVTEMIQMRKDEALKELSETRSVTETDPATGR